MVNLAESRKTCRTASIIILRFYPVVQQIRRMIEAGDLGDILVVQGTYSQDWLLYDTDYNWRIETSRERPLSASSATSGRTGWIWSSTSPA